MNSKKACPTCGRNWSISLPPFKVIEDCPACTAEKQRRLDWAAKKQRGQDENWYQHYQAELAAEAEEKGVTVDELVKAQAEKDRELWKW